MLLTLDELEGLYQVEAAEALGVSRQTFGNIIRSAHVKVADGLAHAKKLRIEGGVVRCVGRRARDSGMEVENQAMHTRDG